MHRTILVITNTTNGLFLFRRELIERLLEKYDVEILAGNTGRVEELQTWGAM